jgi:ATP:ADP antiporter, AAA family
MYPAFLMFSIILLLNMNYTILRSVRNTLAVVDLGGSAQSIPLFELFGALPAAIFMTWVLSHVLMRFTLTKVFYFSLTVFLLFFLLFSCILYPALQGSQKFIWLPKFCSMIFYIMAELWKPALINILFWSLINQNTALEQAKKLYAPLMLGSSVGSICAGPLVMACTSEAFWKFFPLSEHQWTHSFVLLMLVIFFTGIVTGFLYYALSSNYAQSFKKEQKPCRSASLSASIKVCCSQGPLGLLCFVVLAQYVAYSLGEVIFLEVLREKFSRPAEFCHYMGQLAFWCSLSTVFCALFLAPVCLRRYKWVVSAMMLPLSLLLIESAFFIFLRGKGFSSYVFGWSHEQWIAVVVALGSVQYCIARAIKYTFFDTAKELAFVVMQKEDQIKGKLVIDGICARLGRGGSSLLSIFFITISGGILASSFVTGIVAIAVTGSWIFATQKLGLFFNKETDVEEMALVK